MQNGALADRTKQFALAIIRLCANMQNNLPAQTIGKQLIRSGTSVGAQYREASRARSDAEFISKLQSSLQETEESIYWLELLKEANLVAVEEADDKISEAKQIVAMMVASVNTVRRRMQKSN